jgi:hypothetical protein
LGLCGRKGLSMHRCDVRQQCEKKNKRFTAEDAEGRRGGNTRIYSSSSVHLGALWG